MMLLSNLFLGHNLWGHLHLICHKLSVIFIVYRLVLLEANLQAF